MAAIPLAVAAAIASYHFVELPFLRRKRRGSSVDVDRSERASQKLAETPA
jgi:peptidoglycan/LPS O-acetylase OafA/YrhL